MARILYLADSRSASTWYRCSVPGSQLQALGHQVALVNHTRHEELLACDVLVCQRLYQPNAVQALATARGEGVLTVVDIDDDYWNIHPENPVYSDWQKPGVLEGLTHMVRGADLVTTSTHELAGVLGELNSNVKVIRNMIPDEYWPDAAKRLPQDAGTRLVLGWAGSQSHVPDLAILRDVLPHVLERYPFVEVSLAGVPPDSMPSHERLSVLDPVPIEEYASLLARFDIGLAPLLDNKFNRAKSDLKLIEYGMLGLPTVVSKVEPYLRAAKHGENALVAASPKDWLKHISALVERPDLRDRLGASARALAETRLISKNIGRWEKAYRIAPSSTGVEVQQ